MQLVLDIGHEGSLKEKEKEKEKGKGEEYLCATYISCFLYSLKIDLDLASLVGVCESFLDTNPDIRFNLQCTEGNPAGSNLISGSE